MIWVSALRSRIAQWAAAFLVFVAAVTAVWRNGKQSGMDHARDKDFENADKIRRNVERSLDQRVRDYEGRGFRDE